jgi:hypothetical protein
VAYWPAAVLLDLGIWGYMKMTLIFLLTLLNLNAYSASCDVNEFIKSTDGKDKLTSLFERVKTLAISKLEELGHEESTVKFTVKEAVSISALESVFKIDVLKKGMVVESTKAQVTRLLQEEGCGVEIKINAGRLIDKESGKDFGSLGHIKEFVRLN